MTRAADIAASAVNRPRASRRLTAASVAAVAAGAALCAAAWAGGSEAQARLAAGWLWAFAFCWTLTLGGLFFVALHHLVGATWSVGFRRIGEMFAGAMGVVALLFMPVLIFAAMNDRFGLFPAMASGGEAAHLSAGKRAYLSLPWFAARGVVCFALWIGFARFFVRGSLRLDRGEDVERTTGRLRRWSGPFMVLFALSLTVASIDWLMALQPQWFSTIFGVYVFAGLMPAAVGAIALAATAMRSTGRLEPALTTGDHAYSLGGLMFAFTCFWAYIAFSQYMLIWYANQPEESFWIVRRTSGSWLAVSAALALARFVVPFLVLLPRRSKFNRVLLVVMAAWLLGGQLLDLYWLIMPAYHSQGPVAPAAAEFGPLLAAAGLVGLHASRFLARHAPLATGDPLLASAREFHL